MSTDEITTFREGRPEVPQYDRMARARARARLINGSSESTPSPRRRFLTGRRLLAVGAVGAGLALAGSFVVVHNEEAPRSEQPLRLRPVANAQDLASNAAVLAAHERDFRPSPTQWAYVKSLSAQAESEVVGAPPLRGRPKVTLTREQWSRADDKQWADIRKGKLQVHEGTEAEVMYHTVLALPTDPGAMLKQVYQVVDLRVSPGTPEERNTEAFMYISACMWNTALPAKLRAGMYGALAKIPGVRYEAHASDLAGRPGVTLYRVDGGRQRNEIFINPKTYEYMGQRTIIIRDLKGDKERHEVGKKGDIITWFSNLKVGVVDQPGQRL